MGLSQSQQVSLGRQDLPEPIAESCAQIAGLAGLLGDDQDRHGAQPDLNPTMGWKVIQKPARRSLPTAIRFAAPATKFCLTPSS